MTWQGLFPAVVTAIFAGALFGYMSWQSSKVRKARETRLRNVAGEAAESAAEQRRRDAEHAYNKGAADYVRATIRAAEDHAQAMELKQGDLFKLGVPYTFPDGRKQVAHEDQFVHPLYGAGMRESIMPIMTAGNISTVPEKMYEQMIKIATGTVLPPHPTFYGGGEFPNILKPSDKTHG